jgi:hypothetical protein
MWLSNSTELPDLHKEGAIPVSNLGVFITPNTAVSVAAHPPIGEDAKKPPTAGANVTALFKGKVAVNLYVIILVSGNTTTFAACGLNA